MFRVDGLPPKPFDEMHDSHALLSIEPAHPPWARQRSDTVAIPGGEEMPRITQVDTVNTPRRGIHRPDQQSGKVQSYPRRLLGCDMPLTVSLLGKSPDVFRSLDRGSLPIRRKLRYAHVEDPFAKSMFCC
jgi:hypothetical protein